MRFAGQRFRQPKERMGRFTAEDGSMGDVRYRPQIQGLAQSRAQMPEQNVRGFSKTEEPAFIIPEFKEEQFQA